MTKCPKICGECIRWKLYGSKCRYHWVHKSECYSKCYSEKEMIELDALRYEGRL